MDLLRSVLKQAALLALWNWTCAISAVGGKLGAAKEYCCKVTNANSVKEREKPAKDAMLSRLLQLLHFIPHFKYKWNILQKIVNVNCLYYYTSKDQEIKIYRMTIQGSVYVCPEKPQIAASGFPEQAILIWKQIWETCR